MSDDVANESVTALARLEVRLESRDREFEQMFKFMEANLKALREQMDATQLVKYDLYQANLEAQRDRDRRHADRLDILEERDRWLTRALIGAFIGILIQAAVVALSLM